MSRVSCIIFFIVPFLLLSCSKDKGQEGLVLNGTWELQCVVYPDGETYQYDQDDLTLLRIYDDSCYYECRILVAPSGKLAVPGIREHYTLIDHGKNNYLYLQEDNNCPLTVVNDSTIVIQELGRKYTWKVCTTYSDEAVAEITNIVRNDVNDGSRAPHRYVFSYAESHLKSVNHTLVYTLIFIGVAFMMFLNYVYFLYRNKKRVENELKLIEQERQSLPEPVRMAMNSVEDDFHQSEFYLSLRKKISRGERLDKDDWSGIEEHFKSVYPRFNSTLLTLRNMSEIEMQVCQLLKLNVSPSDIATVLCKDKSSISSIRSRLYSKVFDKKGSSKDWDEFIYSL